MGFFLLFLFIGLPVIELMVLIEVGGEIGALNTIGLSFLTAAVGIWLVRLQGLSVMQAMMQGSRSGDPVASPIVHGFFLLVAGFCLLVPGFLTDAFGALCLLPPFRLVAARLLIGRVRAGSGHYSETTVIIDGDYTVVEPKPDSPENADKPELPPKS